MFLMAFYVHDHARCSDSFISLCTTSTPSTVSGQTPEWLGRRALNAWRRDVRMSSAATGESKWLVVESNRLYARLYACLYVRALMPGMGLRDGNPLSVPLISTSWSLL